MKLLLKNHFENAIEALRANRTRTMLTITGVTIGVASITAILSLAGGATEFFGNQIAETRGSVALVRPTQVNNTDSLFIDAQTLPATTTLTEQDANDLGRLVNATVAPMAILHTGLQSSEGKIDGKNATLIGSNQNLATVANLSMLDGQFLDSTTTSGIVMGKQLAIDLFGTEHALGSVVTIRGESFTVMGTMNATNQPINYHGVNFDKSAIIPLSMIKQFTQNVAQIQQITIIANDQQPIQPIVDQAQHILSTNHHGETDFTILTGSDITAPNSRLFSIITTVVAIITGISLLVGGIGIMNIMLVNVAERNREVGIRKAIGAADGHIVNQFLIESAIVGLLGGLLGYAVGMIAAFGLSMYLPFGPVLQWQAAAISIGMAILTGIIFGLYPAVCAAKRNPIEALRQ